MIRVLFLRRRRTGGMSLYCDTLAQALEEFGVEAVIDDVEDWIPDKTGWSVDRNVSKKLKKAAQGFQMVHAFGFRAAWACSEAFYVREPWVYSAFDMPRTRHPHLVDRLNAAKRGLCSSRAVRDVLKEAETLMLEVAIPCVADVPPLDSKEAIRESLGLNQDDRVVYWEEEDPRLGGLESLITSLGDVTPYIPNTFYVVRMEGKLTSDQESLIHETHSQVKVLTPKDSREMWMKAADLLVAPERNLGFSMAAAQAMALGTPVLLRRDGGLAEMAAEGESGFFFDIDSELGMRIRLLLEAPMTLEAVARAGMIRAQDRFDSSTAASVMARTYRDVLGI